MHARVVEPNDDVWVRTYHNGIWGSLNEYHAFIHGENILLFGLYKLIIHSSIK